jgi:hypothetical protein
MTTYLYSALNQRDINKELAIILRKKCGITSYVVDFDCNEYLVKSLIEAGFKSTSYRYKLYSEDVNNPSYELIESEMRKARSFGFSAFAFDLEAYSGSKIWESETYAMEFSGWLAKTLPKYFKSVVFYPEYLGGEKYANYCRFINNFILRSRGNVNVIILLERTYEVWKPWEIVYLYWRSRLLLPNAKHVIGVWPEELMKLKGFPKIFSNWLFLGNIAQFIQKLTLCFFRDKFFYTEERFFTRDPWLQFLARKWF